MPRLLKTYRCTNKLYHEHRVYDFVNKTRLGNCLLKLSDQPKVGDFLLWNSRKWEILEYDKGFPFIGRGEVVLRLKIGK